VRQAIRELRKAELHLHLEGSIDPETILEIDPSISVEEAHAMYRFTGFAGFLASYKWLNRKLTSPEHYALAARRLFAGLREQNVLYAEITISVGVILWKRQEFAPIFEALKQEALAADLKIRWIFDAVRHFGADAAWPVAELAVKHRPGGVVAFGIGGDEVRGPVEWFGEISGHVRRHGLAFIPHAGEIAGPDSIWRALELGARRIGHGIRAADDPLLIAHLRDRDIPLEVCVSSNICTGVVGSIDEHPLGELYEAGVPITLNSDDPPMFQTTLTAEYELLVKTWRFGLDDLRRIAANGFRYSLV
jgi:adenosine deaminase/aminodeoxyfutalosine deaminase